MGERQYGTIDQIRRDHVARYQFARDRLALDTTVIDAACGCGYGSYLLAQGGCEVQAYDGSKEAIAYAKFYYSHPRIEYKQELFPCDFPPVDTAVCFETVEHVEDDYGLLCKLREAATNLIVSVPNQEKLPFTKKRFPFHIKHYTIEDISALLDRAGWQVKSWYGQADAFSEVIPRVNGRTLIMVCK